MKRHRVTMVVAVTVGSVLLTGATAAAQTHPAGGAHAASGGGWGTAARVPGLAALNTGDFASVTVMSCASAGNCSAAGFYTPGSAEEQVFVVTETNGTWGKAEELPGLATLDGGNGSEVFSLSCGSAGNCSAGGTYTSVFGGGEAFVADETNGTWGTAEEVPGSMTLNASGNAEVNSVSCASAGNCSAGGFYSDSSGHDQAFVVTETSGTWGTAKQVPGSGALNTGGNAQINSVSCASPGDCSAGGSYKTSSGTQAFAVTETSGTWGTAKQVPGTAALNKGKRAGVGVVSCTSPGNCSAGGDYVGVPGGSLDELPFVVTQTNGVWGTAKEIPGIAALNKGGNAPLYSLSCGAAGNCSAGGFYQSSAHASQAFVVNEKQGTWDAAEEVPGTAALNVGGGAQAQGVSCPSAGHCGAGGSYTASSGAQAFVVGKT